MLILPRNLEEGGQGAVNPKSSYIYTFVKSYTYEYQFKHFKGAEVTCVGKVTAMKTWFILKDMLDFNVLWNF